MAILVEETNGKTRDLPIDGRLKMILLQAGSETRIERIRVTSGGQCAVGTCAKRTGSTRHDLGKAADLELWYGNRPLNFTSDSDLPFFRKFVSAVARLGATGIGAGVGYMGEHAVHVGFGTRSVWGESGKSANAPAWLKEAAKEGWASSIYSVPLPYRVVARRGLHLRSGPGIEFKTMSTIEPGTIVSIEGFDGEREEWAKTDLQGDGLIDGHLHKSFLVPVDPTESNSSVEEDDCSTDTSDNQTHHPEKD